MAVKGSGVVGKTIDPAMQDQTSYDARSGAAKRPQTSFPDKWGMKDMTTMSGLVGGASNLGTGPDASSPNPLSSSPAVKTLKRQPAVLKGSWGMTDADGKGVDNSIGGKVLGEAVISGSTKLPAAVKVDNGRPPNPS